jgi:hypothetical protein
MERRIRTLGGRLIRRAGLLPAGAPDRRGDDADLLGTTLPHDVMVFYPNPPGSLQRLEQWYGALREIDRRHRVVVVLEDSRTARSVRQRSSLEVITVASYTTMDDLLSRSDIKLALYVDDHEENFSNLRFASMVHARLLDADPVHPESSHLLKAYDFALVFDDAVIERIAACTTFYDARARCIPTGTATVGASRNLSGLLAAVDRLIGLRDGEHARLTGPTASRG